MVALSATPDRTVLPYSSDGVRSALWTVAVVAIIAAFVAGSIIWHNGSFLLPESDLFLVDHNDPDRSFVSKVLSPHVHDAGLYQGRELSHVLEFLDAQFIDWCVRLGLPHFYSIVTYVLLVSLSLLHWHFATTRLGLDRLSCALLLGLFWTSPCIFFSGQFLRDAKQGAALLLFLLIWFLFLKLGIPADPSERKTSEKSVWRNLSLVAPAFLLGLALCFMDRQGFFLTGIAAVSLLVLGLFPVRSSYLKVAAALIAPLLLHTLYTRAVAPWLIYSVNGFTVSFEYQRLPWDKLFLHPAGYFQQGATLLVNHFRYFLGNMGEEAQLPVLIVWGAMVMLFYKAGGTRPGKGYWWLSGGRWGALFLFWVVALIGLYTLMVLRHYVLVWPDIRTHYYWIPTITLILLACTFCVHQLNQRVRPAWSWAPNCVLAVALLANLKTIPEHHRIKANGHLQGYIELAPHLLRELRSLPAGQPALSGAVKFDTKKSVMIDTDLSADNRRQTLDNALANKTLTPDQFVASSHYYNFVRSRRNLPFRQ
jgi:hypothetical protein